MFFLCGLGVFPELWIDLKNVSGDEGILCNSISPRFAYLKFPQPLTLRRSGGSFVWVRRLVSLSANRGIFRVFFSENLRPYNNAVKKKTVFRAFLAILSPFMSIRCDAEAGYAICLCVWGTNLWFIASSK